MYTVSYQSLRNAGACQPALQWFKEMSEGKEVVSLATALRDMLEKHGQDETCTEWMHFAVINGNILPQHIATIWDNGHNAAVVVYIEAMRSQEVLRLETEIAIKRGVLGVTSAAAALIVADDSKEYRDYCNAVNALTDKQRQIFREYIGQNNLLLQGIIDSLGE